MKALNVFDDFEQGVWLLKNVSLALLCQQLKFCRISKSDLHNSDMISQAQDKINNIFSEKCENFVRIEEKIPNKKIIRLPKRLTDSDF